ncbi:MAG TPA: NADH-quinone oxidoreductase subunit L [Actinomycetota bacterium]|nr:NADH-quinone oxidoreductase subunit L [Actinomycetota bacterium]
MIETIWLAPALPLLGAVLLLLFGKPLRKAAGGLASALVGGSFVVAILAWRDFSASPPVGDQGVAVKLFDWISVGGLEAPFELRVDPLSLVMALVVSGVAFLIHVYSMDYMHGDVRYSRYFAYLNLFVGAMLLLVLANNLVLMFVGWEGVGLCSYLLISFWFERKPAADAGKKAFIVTRIGDTLMLLGIFLIYSEFGTVSFDELSRAGADHAALPMTAIALLLFAGAVGKSAQLPLHTWLPDAMEGPTPVSALIHAATMVTAGVFLIARVQPLFEASPDALFVIAVVGTLTAIYAATSALAQTDLKRVLAYSTISQLGLMFLAAGVGAYAVAIFHLVTHAFFKALLFLGAGSVMHATDGEIDMTRLGGLRRSLPWTTGLFVIGSLALAGVPLLAGFYSKDQILAAAYETGHTWLWIGGLAASLLTGVYATRAVALTFFGEPRAERHPHESPLLMTVPMALLGLGAVFGGLLGLSATAGAIQRFLNPIFGGEAEHALEGGLGEGQLVAIAVAIAVIGVALGWAIWGTRTFERFGERVRLAGARRFLARGWYLDDVYGALLVMPGKAASAFTAFVLDQRVVDGAVNGLARGTGRLATAGRRIQSGLVRNYALSFLVGAVLLLVVLGWRA